MTISRRVADTTNSSVIVDTQAHWCRQANTLREAGVCRTRNYANDFQANHIQCEAAKAETVSRKTKNALFVVRCHHQTNERNTEMALFRSLLKTNARRNETNCVIMAGQRLN